MPVLTPMDPDRINAALRDASVVLGPVDVVAETGSTNADIADAARAGAPHGTTLVTSHQTAGRGRFVREWEDAAGTSIAMSVLLRPPADVPGEAWGWLPLLVGIGVVDGLRNVTGLPAVLKWPNDVLLLESGERSATRPVLRTGKLVGVLAEGVSTPDGLACVAGIGINVAMDVAELPVETATSLLLNGVDVARDDVVVAVLAGIDHWYRRWLDGVDLTEEYQARCATIGARVRVQLDEQLGLGDLMTGVAVGVDPTGSLLVCSDVDASVRAVSAGDVVHVR